MNDCELLVDQQQFRRIAIRQTFSDRILDNYWHIVVLIKEDIGVGNFDGAFICLQSMKKDSYQIGSYPSWVSIEQHLYDCKLKMVYYLYIKFSVVYLFM